MPEITFPDLQRSVAWRAEGEWRYGTIQVANERGVVASLTGRVHLPTVVAICKQIREQLARQAPANVNVGEWVDLNGPAQQDLHRYVMEQELDKSLLDQVTRRGWVVEPPWFGPWDADVVIRAYRLIEAATAQDPLAMVQLDRIRSGALENVPEMIEALGKFSAVGRMIARGMSLEAVCAALGVSADGVVDLGAVMRASRTRGAGRPKTPSRPMSAARPMGSPYGKNTGSVRTPAARAPVVARPLAAARPLAYIPVVPRPAAVPYPPAYPYGYPYGYPPGGGGGGGEGGGGGDFPDFPDDGGAQLDGLDDPIPPPPEDGELAGRYGRDAAAEEFPEPPADDGSGNVPFAAAPDENGKEPGGPAPDGVPTGAAPTAAPVSAGAPAGGNVEMVPDMGDDVYPDEGAPFGSK